MSNEGCVVTLLTDFGTADGYVAAMKGVILSYAPNAKLVDASHEIAPQDVRGAAWALAQYWRWFPPGSIHIAVVDPGVGTDRVGLMVGADGHIFLAPDNGLLSYVVRQAQRIELRKIRATVVHPQGASSTFHGRDVFAVAAGRLCAGERVADLSEPADCIVVPEWGQIRVEGNCILGEVVHVDRFGNLITNISKRQLAEVVAARVIVRCERAGEIPLVRTYADVPPGSVLALINSADVLEIAVNLGSAAKVLGCGRGAMVEVVGVSEQ